MGNRSRKPAGVCWRFCAEAAWVLFGAYNQFKGVVVVGSISYIGLIVPNIVAMFKGDQIRGTLVDTALFGALFVLVCDMIGRVVIYPYELPIELPGNIRLLDNISSITVSFDSSKLETKTMNLPASCVQVVNLPSTYTLTVQTERLMNVTLCGPAGLLDTLVPEQVVIEIDADDFYVAAGQQNIACRLYVPSNGKIFALGSYVIQCKIESN